MFAFSSSVAGRAGAQQGAPQDALEFGCWCRYKELFVLWNLLGCCCSVPLQDASVRVLFALRNLVAGAVAGRPCTVLLSECCLRSGAWLPVPL